MTNYQAAQNSLTTLAREAKGFLNHADANAILMVAQVQAQLAIADAIGELIETLKEQ